MLPCQRPAWRASLHFRLLQLQLPCASFGPAWLRWPRPASPPTCAHAHTLARSHLCIHTCSSSPSYRVGWHRFACREPRTECEAVRSSPSLVHWSIARSAVPCDLRCQVPACAVWLPVSLCLSFSTIILLHTSCVHSATSQSTYPFRLSGPGPATLSSACRSIPFAFEHRARRRTDRGTDRHAC